MRKRTHALVSSFRVYSVRSFNMFMRLNGHRLVLCCESYVDVCVCGCVRVCVCACVHAHAHAHAHAHTHAHTNPHTHTHTNALTHPHTHKYINTYAHTHACHYSVRSCGYFMQWHRLVGSIKRGVSNLKNHSRLPQNQRSFLQNIVCLIGLFCKRDL